MKTKETKNIDILNIITKETKNNISKTPIVIPSKYEEIFMKNLKEFDINNELKEQIKTKETKRNEETKKELFENAENLEINSTKAITAIETNDNESLKEIVDEINILKENLKKVKEKLYTDELTSAKNRNWLREKFLENKEEFQNDGYISFIDMTDFKTINDKLGHDVGDKALKSFVLLLSKSLNKKENNIVRFGGDEFLVLSKEDINKELNYLKKNLTKKIFKYKDNGFTINFDFGCIQYIKNDDFKNKISEVDYLMYKNKKENKEKEKRKANEEIEKRLMEVI